MGIEAMLDAGINGISDAVSQGGSVRRMSRKERQEKKLKKENSKSNEENVLPDAIHGTDELPSKLPPQA